jgi:hypothetical protein
MDYNFAELYQRRMDVQAKWEFARDVREDCADKLSATKAALILAAIHGGAAQYLRDKITEAERLLDAADRDLITATSELRAIWEQIEGSELHIEQMDLFHNGK